LRKVVKRDEVENRRAKAIEAEKTSSDSERRGMLSSAQNALQLQTGRFSISQRGLLRPQVWHMTDGSENNGELAVRTPIPVKDEPELETWLRH